MKNYLCAMIAFGLILIGFFSAFGQVKEGVYSNQFTGLRFRMPETWHIANAEQINEIFSRVDQMPGCDGPEYQEMGTQMPDAVMLMVSEHPYDPEATSTNSNIFFFAINFREETPHEDPATQYLKDAADGIEESYGDVEISEIQNSRIENHELKSIIIGYKSNESSMFQSQMALVNNDYLIVIAVTAETRSEIDELMNYLIANLRVEAVDEVLDASPEGVAFRQDSTLDFSSPTPSGSGKKSWLWYVVIGFFLVFGGGSATKL